jgi:ssDNA-binding Zn-finger/Zn-ribbon topoisomerase 1
MTEEREATIEESSAGEVLDHFNQVLSQHLEHLIGTSYGIGALPLTLENIACLILLAEQEGNESEDFSDPSERLTRAALLLELKDIGLSHEKKLLSSLNELIEKGYIETDHEGRFFARKPAISMVQLIERVFPHMPGVNFIAYSTQILGEVHCGRKLEQIGLSHFDQTLRRQGVPLKREKDQSKLNMASVEKKSLTEAMASLNTMTHEIMPMFQTGLPDSETQVGHENNPIDPSAPVTESDNQSFPQKSALMDADKNDVVEDSPSMADEEPENYPEVYQPFGTPAADLAADRQGSPLSEEEIDRHALNANISIASPMEKGFFPATFTSATENNIPIETRGPEPQESTESDNDHEIGEKIACFEEGLAMQCPLCRVGSINIEKTSMGKAYYKCTNKECIFISWGRPHHLVCPFCQNPFLIESKMRDDETILKCPRATCRYRQALPGENTEHTPGNTSPQAQGSVKKRIIVRRPRRNVKKKRLVRVKQ